MSLVEIVLFTHLTRLDQQIASPASATSRCTACSNPEASVGFVRIRQSRQAQTSPNGDHWAPLSPRMMFLLQDELAHDGAGMNPRAQALPSDRCVCRGARAGQVSGSRILELKMRLNVFTTERCRDECRHGTCRAFATAHKRWGSGERSCSRFLSWPRVWHKLLPGSKGHRHRGDVQSWHRERQPGTVFRHPC